MSDSSGEKQTNALDQFLKFGRFQAISAWVLSSLLGFFSAFSNGHLMFILFDPPQGGWWCEEGGVPLCDDNAEGCESDSKIALPLNCDYRKGKYLWWR